MRVLWVTREFPDAQGSGAQVHQFELLRSVADSHEVSIISSFWDISRDALLSVQRMGVDVDVVSWPWNRMSRGRMRKVARLVTGRAPTALASAMTGQLRPLSDAVVAHERSRPVDVVCIFQGDLAPIADATNAPSALFLFDVFSRQADLVLKDGGWSTRSLRRRLERRMARRWEPAWYRKADSVACVSAVDADIVRAMLNRPVSVIPNPIPDAFFAPPQGSRSSSTVTFVGSLSWEPNIDSVEWICSDIWPGVRALRPDARLRVVGRFPTQQLRRTVESAGGEFFADVDDVRPYYWESAVAIAPVRMGSGMRNKVLHAMACGAPVVATPSAIEGIPAVGGEHLLVADGAAGIAGAIADVLNDPASASRRAQAAAELARGYTSAAAGSALESWWNATAALRSGRRVEAPQPRAPLTATVIVCTRERPEMLRACLKSVQASIPAASAVDVMVVEQGKPSAAEACADIGLAATVISDAGSGVSRARNIGLRNARGNVVLFTDDDCEVPVHWVRDHLEALRQSDVDASFGRVTGLSRWGDDESDAAAMPARHRRGAAPWLIGHSSNFA
ncbi:MAG TPA: glycosyltransferase, partial [Actinomycetota bacterium]|nr:glycosyltransferase [Actinomycetota bacterium]